MSVSCQYLTKVFSGEEYFTDFNYFLGYICEESFKLKLGTTTVSFATILKRLPLTIRKKIKLVKCNKIQLISAFSALNYSSKKEKILYTKSLNNINEVVIVTLKIDEFKNTYFKIEKDNPQKTLICANVP
uniref:Uncharacterized protein n=1 Tax=Panagrolaimus sp. JU765 TaxID=591449 RepID=A0AC34RKS9_9BILA